MDDENIDIVGGPAPHRRGSNGSWLETQRRPRNYRGYWFLPRAAIIVHIRGGKGLLKCQRPFGTRQAKTDPCPGLLSTDQGLPAAGPPAPGLVTASVLASILARYRW